MFVKFWWEQRGNEHKVHLVGWQKLLTLKLHGGMGFKDLELFNVSLLAKQGWRLLHDSHSLLFRVFKAKYFSNSDYLRSTLGNHPSYVW